MFNSIVMLDASVRGLLLALLWLGCYCFLAEGGCWWLGFYACLRLCLCWFRGLLRPCGIFCLFCLCVGLLIDLAWILRIGYVLVGDFCTVCLLCGCCV